MGKEQKTMENNKQALRMFVKKNGSVVVFAILCIVAAIFVPRFASVNNFLLIIKQSAIPVIACIGMTMVLMTGGIDLSLGYTIGLSSTIVGMLVKTHEMAYLPAILITLGVGVVIGLINGFCVQAIKVPAFITTLGTGYIIYGIAEIVSHGESVNRLPKGFLAIGKTEVLGVNTTVVITAVICLVFFYILHMSTFGRNLSAFGLSEPASRLSGVATAKINVMVYVNCAVLASLVGILLSIDVNCAQPTMGGGNYTFEVITGAVLGGASLFGGVGSVVGALFGVMTIKVIGNCINLMNAAYYLYDAIMGIIILAAIVFENIKNRKL
ncbi:ABC transporter permease [[Clostridium] symbiosum]|uniref:ABC transporter permease n=1 Tax=Clostridium symbiosum TaxID=1512 RepID=UPI001D05C664|nr:ABC transporter permease [[Clostridium] symbiosum]MCB6608008.1 ABC transporter permease [[Clostridium] symbiosum]MCB6931349.1 ABC transporter permease [[Clostridium] symbiosum]